MPRWVESAPKVMRWGYVETTATVRWNECDGQGHAYYGSYVPWCDLGREAFALAVGVPYWKYKITTTEFHIRYHTATGATEMARKALEVRPKPDAEREDARLAAPVRDGRPVRVRPAAGRLPARASRRRHHVARPPAGRRGRRAGHHRRVRAALLAVLGRRQRDRPQRPPRRHARAPVQSGRLPAPAGRPRTARPGGRGDAALVVAGDPVPADRRRGHRARHDQDPVRATRWSSTSPRPTATSWSSPTRTRSTPAGSPNPHIAFGHGPHFCVAAQLARVQMRAMFGAVLDRFATVELAGAAATAAVELPERRQAPSDPMEHRCGQLSTASTPSATPEQVWRRYLDLPTWPEWNGAVSVIALDGPFANGTAGTLTPPGQGPLPFRLVSVTENLGYVSETDIADTVTLRDHRDPGRPGRGRHPHHPPGRCWSARPPRTSPRASGRSSRPACRARSRRWPRRPAADRTRRGPRPDQPRHPRRHGPGHRRVRLRGGRGLAGVPRPRIPGRDRLRARAGGRRWRRSTSRTRPSGSSWTTRG